jgi:hypothetical protein
MGVAALLSLPTILEIEVETETLVSHASLSGGDSTSRR